MGGDSGEGAADAGTLGRAVRAALGAGGPGGALLAGELEAAVDRALAPAAWAADFAPALGALAGFARGVPGVAASLQGGAEEEPEEAFYVVPDADLVERLVAAPAEELEGVLGEALYPLVEALQPVLAGQLTGMFLELDACDALNLVGDPAALVERVGEALEVLREAGMLAEEEAEGDPAAPAADTPASPAGVAEGEEESADAGGGGKGRGGQPTGERESDPGYEAPPQEPAGGGAGEGGGGGSGGGAEGGDEAEPAGGCDEPEASVSSEGAPRPAGPPVPLPGMPALPGMPMPLPMPLPGMPGMPMPLPGMPLPRMPMPMQGMQLPPPPVGMTWVPGPGGPPMLVPAPPTWEQLQKGRGRGRGRGGGHGRGDGAGPKVVKLPEEGRLPWMAKGQRVTVARQSQGGSAAVRQRRPAWGRLQKGLNVHAAVFQPNPKDFPSLQQEEPEEDREAREAAAREERDRSPSPPPTGRKMLNYSFKSLRKSKPIPKPQPQPPPQPEAESVSERDRLMDRLGKQQVLAPSGEAQGVEKRPGGAVDAQAAAEANRKRMEELKQQLKDLRAAQPAPEAPPATAKAPQVSGEDEARAPPEPSPSEEAEEEPQEGQDSLLQLLNDIDSFKN